MRLIDVNEFKNLLNSGGEATNINISKSMPLGKIVDIVIQAYRKCLFAELEKMPTAYDVDKVVEQLHKTQVYKFQGKLPDGRICHFSDVIELVKAGGTHEDD